MEKRFDKMTISELQDILYNIESASLLSLKLDDIHSTLDVINDKCKPTTEMMININKDMSSIENICNKTECDVCEYFKKFGIYINSNIEDMEEMIENVLKRKLCRILKNRMRDYPKLCENMETYIDNYFENFDISKKVDHLAYHVEDWIHFIKDLEKNANNGLCSH